MPRTHRSTRGIALASLLLGAGALAACTPPMPPDVLAAIAESQITCRVGEVEVSAADGLGGAMDAVGQGLASACPGQSTAVVAASRVVSVRLLGTAPTSRETSAFARGACATGTVVSVPAFAYGVALAYNVVGLEGLVLTPQAMAGILEGTVTSWEDPVIASANPEYDLSGLPQITVLGLEQDQAAAQAMTEWLATPGFRPRASATFSDMATLLEGLAATQGAVAVVPAFAAVANGIPVAASSVEGVVVSPDDAQAVKIGAGATIVVEDEAGGITASPAIGGVPRTENFDAGAAKVLLAEDQPLVGWPVVGIAHLQVCDRPDDPLPMSFAQYALRLAGQGAVETFGLTPLPEPVRVRTFGPLKAQALPTPSSQIRTVELRP